jgi:predicted ATP-grasp superfamily ATP-dependent carboligase
MVAHKVNILIIDNNSPFVLPLLRSYSGYSNLKIDLLLCSERKPENFIFSRYLRNVYKVDTLNAENFHEVLVPIIKRAETDFVVPTREWISSLLYENRAQLEQLVRIHPVPGRLTLEITGNKRNLNQWLKENGFPYALVQNMNDVWLGGFPVLIKPVFGIGGAGIRVIHHADALKSAMENDGINNEIHILQGYLEGYDIDFSLFAVDGKILAHTIQRGFISDQMTYSKGIEFINNEEFYSLVEAIIRKLNYTGIAHLDFRFNEKKNQYVLIDFNSRYWSSVLGSKAMGVNFPYLTLAYSMGEEVIPSQYRTGHYYFTTAALRTILKNIFSRNRQPIKLSDTQLHYIILDPKPEFIFLVNRFLKPFHKIFSIFNTLVF